MPFCHREYIMGMPTSMPRIKPDELYLAIIERMNAHLHIKGVLV